MREPPGLDGIGDEEAQLAAVLALLTFARSPGAGQAHGLTPVQRWRAQRAAALARDAAEPARRPPVRRA
jgi:hypothetical protein